MSDLIEKVRDVLVKNESETFKDQARAAIAAVAEWLKPTTERPCDCTSCYCGNTGDAENTSSWDTQQWLYADLLKQLEQPKGAAGDGR